MTNHKLLVSLALVAAVTWQRPAAAQTSYARPAYFQLQEEGTDIPRWSVLNFVGPAITCADDAASHRSTCTLTAATGTVTSVGTGNGLQGGPIIAAGTIDLRLNASGGLSKTLGGGSNELGIAASGITSSMVGAGTYGIDISGNAGTVTNGVYTTGSYANPSWITALAASKLSGVVAVANGGTNSSGALNNNRLMWSSGSAIVEATALTNGQLFIGSTGAAPVAASLSNGGGITATGGAGTITLGSSGGGDLSGAYSSATVVALRGIPYANVSPTDGYALVYDFGGNRWVPSILNGDVYGQITAALVQKIQGRTVASTAPTDHYGLLWNNGSSQWQPTAIPYAIVAGSGVTVSGSTGSVTITGGGLSIFGDGSDGAATFDGAATPAGSVKDDATHYHLTRDVYYTSTTVSAGVAVTANGYMIFVTGTLTIPATAKLHNNGSAASGATGGSAAPAGTLNNTNSAGAAGQANAGQATSNTTSFGGAGGTGGNGSSGSGAAGGTASLTPGGGAFVGGLRAAGNVAVIWAFSGAGVGGGSGSGDASNSSGGGGGGAGAIHLCARDIVLGGTIEAIGGAGGQGAAGNVGGGGGGGGGPIYIVRRTRTGAGSISAAGGAGGAGRGTGTAGTSGSAGTIVEIAD
jgi:hypothetical protein